MLVPLADLLEVTVTELLECKRNEEQESGKTEQVVRKAIQMANISENKNPFWRWFILACIVCAVELFGLRYWIHPQLLSPVSIVMILVAFMGGYACFFMKDSLPGYYDENKINYYSNGVFRMNLVGLSFNNSNWPYIVKVIRIWSLSMLTGYPLAYAFIMTMFERWIQMASILLYACAFGSLIILVYYFGKKYE